MKFDISIEPSCYPKCENIFMKIIKKHLYWKSQSCWATDYEAIQAYPESLKKNIETIEKSDWENKLWNQSKIKMYIKRQTWFISVQAHLVKLKTGEFSTFSYVHGDSARNNCTKTFVKEVYLELNQTSTRRIFCQKSYWGLVDNYLLRKVHHRW